ncbi:MAG: hypothetical protein K1Y02_07090 [Candidatus Hydrogenedentes bacterium]|nr:hypothetical protein [Candidatus Hydrogenedentota bacterium]
MMGQFKFHAMVRLIPTVCLGLMLSTIALADVAFTPDGFVIRDGRPHLILGVYELPADDALLKQMADSGINLVSVGGDATSLDRLQKLGMWGWVPLGPQVALPEGNQEAKAALEATVKRFKDHPALLCWEGPDEALWLEWFKSYDWQLGEQPKRLMELIQKAAPTHSQEDVARWNGLLLKGADYAQRSMWKESEEAINALWKELGSENPNPDLQVTNRIQAANRLGDELTRGWECVWSLDKNHVFWQNHAPGNSIADLRHFNRGVHAAGCDIYPAPFNKGVLHGSTLPNIDLTVVGDFTEHMRAGAPGKACWMVLQGFGWVDLQDRFNPTDPVNGRQPTYAETRFMAYNSLLHGANALIYWGTSYIKKDGALWGDIMKVCKELRALEPAIVGTVPPMSPVVLAETNYTAFNGGDPKLLFRQVDNDWVLIAMNEQRVGVAFQIEGLPEELEGKTLFRLYSNEEHTVNDGGFRDGVAAQGVHVYATSRKFEAKL